jgi:hypothetical protein
MSDDNTPPNDDAKFTQADIDAAIEQRLARERKKHAKELDKFSGLDMDKYQELLDKQADAEKAELERKGEYDKLIKQQAEEKNAEISRLHSIIEKRERDGELLAAAARGNAVAPDQIAELLKGQVRVNTDGKTEVVDAEGTARYNDKGEALQVSDLVNEFLTTNPHFVKASQGGNGSAGAVGGDTQKPKAVGEMTPSEYAEYRKTINRGNAGGGFIKPN